MSKKISKKVKESVADEVATGCDYVQLGETIIASISALPQLELYPDRKVFLEVIKGECKETLINLIQSLSNKYCTLYKNLKGKDAYINLQIQWFDYIRSMAVYAQEQCIEDIVTTYIVDM